MVGQKHSGLSPGRYEIGMRVTSLMGGANSLEGRIPERSVHVLKLIARVFDQNRESGLVREWSFAGFGSIDRRIELLNVRC